MEKTIALIFVLVLMTSTAYAKMSRSQQIQYDAAQIRSLQLENEGRRLDNQSKQDRRRRHMATTSQRNHDVARKNAEQRERAKRAKRARHSW